MKESNLTFSEGFLGLNAKRAMAAGNDQLAFNWDEAARIIKEHLEKHPDLIAEAGLQGDWAYTGGVIFQNGKPTNSSYTYLASNWAKPTLILSWDGGEQLEMQCHAKSDESRFDSGSKWDADSLKVLGLDLSSESINEE